MIILDDFSRPLPRVQNVFLRRSTTIILSFVTLPLAIIAGVIGGFFDGVKFFFFFLGGVDY